jgi:murein DD-endopeptidase MepM/ murein hydrolase activator NlpD
MVRVDGPKAPTFRVERLEERCLLAGVLPWPIKAPDIIQNIAATYGQFDNRLLDREGEIHFHSGIDIGVAAGTKVYAIEAGTVHKAGPFNEPAGFLSIATDDKRGWNYLHIYPDSKWL